MGHGDSPQYTNSHRYSPDYDSRDRKERKHFRERSRSRSQSRDRDYNHRKRRSHSSSSRSRSRTPSPPKYREKGDRRGFGYERKEKNWDSKYDKYRDEIEDNRGRHNRDRWKDKNEAFQEQQEKFMEK